MTSKNKGEINKIVANIRGMTDKMNYQLDAAKKDSIMADLKQIRPVLDNARKISEDLKDIMARVRRGEGTVGKLLVDEEISDEVRKTLAGVRKMVTKVDAIQTELSAFTGVNTKGTSRTEAGLKIYPSPERFYLLGISTSEMGVIKEHETTTIENGVSNVVTTKVRDKDSLLFNIQLGRKYHNWQFRGGLIESSGGVGIDYDIRKINTLLSVELFDYSKEIGPNLRLSSELFIWNVIYSRIALEDVAYDFSVTISAGLRFTDEDIKGLLGFFL
jgi:phospholipid/cholesterol/gamma-HCH transport system substrate-binding protein